MIKFHKQLFILLVIILDRFSTGQQNGFTETYLYSELDNITKDTDTTLGISEESNVTVINNEDITSEISSAITTVEEKTITENDIFTITPEITITSEAENIVTETNTIASKTEDFKRIFPITYYSSTSSEISSTTESTQSTTPTTKDDSVSTETLKTTENDISTTEESTTEIPTTYETTPENPDYCKDVSITNVNAAPNTFSIYLTWDCFGEACADGSSCEYTYTITYNDSTLSTDEHFINITKNIQSCATYSGVIELIYYDTEVISFVPFTATTLPAIDPVQDLIFEEDKEKQQILITWNPSERSQNCVNKYLYEVFEDNRLIWISYKKSPELYVLHVDGCKDNLYKISAVYNESLISNSKELTYSNITLNEAPIYVGKNITEDNNVFIWWKFGKFCKPGKFFVKCQLDNEKSFEAQGTLNLKDDILTLQLTHLEAYQNYSCQGRIENEKGNSSWSEKVNFETFPAEPEPPADLQINQAANGNSVDISWKPPGKWNGKEEEYKLVIEFLHTTYYLPERCREQFTFSNETVYMNSSTTRYHFMKSYASAEYKMSISAISSGGEGSAIQCRFVTLEQVPDIADNLEIIESVISLEIIYDVTFNINWLIPCKINGNLSNYTLQVDGPGIHDFTEIIEYCQVCHYNFSVLPDSKYDIKIHANLKTLEGEIGEIYKASSAGIPAATPNKNLTKPNANDLDEPEYTVRLYIDKDLFDHSMGQIVYYAIIVAEDGCEEEQKTGVYDVDKWPVIKGKKCDKKGQPYEATYKRWNPFLKYDSKIENYVLGCNKSCNELNYCNRPLQPDTNYTVKIRGFTKNGFCDTKLIDFQTSVLNAIPLALILGLIVGIIVIACVIAAALFYRKGKLNFKNWPRMDSSQQISPAPLPVTIKRFPSRFAKMIENPGKIKNEFQLLSTISSDVTLSTKHATLPINRKKNRYINILPYDQTRVQLLDNPANSSDYINASYIKGYSGINEYIATQGPTESTSPAFWQMIMEQNIKLIVMLTQFVESGKEKCYKYFPEQNEDYLANGITIQCVDETIMDIYNKRIFRVVKGTTSKKIIHVQFNIWPDFGVPNEIDHMIDFCNTIKDINRRKPGLILIHCSAGVGRTGTLIAVDILLQNIRDKRKVDIFGTVLNLRKQRTTMVQSERQYEFLYRCINHVITKSDIQQSKTQLEHITEHQVSESNML